MITQIDDYIGGSVETHIFIPCWWFTHTSDHSNVKPQVHVMRELNLQTSLRRDGYIHQMITEQQQCINLALRDYVNDFGEFKRSMFL